MTFAEIKELTGLGFTPEQIMQLSAEPAPAADPEPAPPADPEPAPAADPEPAPAAEQPNPELSGLQTMITDTQTQLRDLIRQMQHNNLQVASMQLAPKDTLEQATDKAMAELIRPTIKTKEA